MLSEWMEQFGVRVVPAEERPDWPEIQHWPGPVWRLADLFTTRDGRWYHEDGVMGSVPQWAVDAYGREDFPEKGAATHLFGAALESATMAPGAGFWFWSSGLAALANYQTAGIVQREAQASGWANIPIEHGSGYVPPAPGPWCYAKYGKSDVVAFVGLPWSWHLSTFAVWEPGEETPPPGGQEYTIYIPDLVAAVDRLTETLREAFRLTVG